MSILFATGISSMFSREAEDVTVNLQATALIRGQNIAWGYLSSVLVEACLLSDAKSLALRPSSLNTWLSMYEKSANFLSAVDADRSLLELIEPISVFTLHLNVISREINLEATTWTQMKNLAYQSHLLWRRGSKEVITGADWGHPSQNPRLKDQCL